MVTSSFATMQAVDEKLVINKSGPYIAYRTSLGSSFTASHTGHKEVVDDLKSATPSVLQDNDTFSG